MVKILNFTKQLDNDTKKETQFLKLIFFSFKDRLLIEFLFKNGFYWSYSG